MSKQTPLASDARLTRRGFLGAAAGALTVPTLVPASVFGANAPSNRINLGIIGLGDRGPQHIRTILPMQGTQISAVCDVYRSKAQRWKTHVDKFYAQRNATDYKGCAAYQDARELIARDDIDAVFVASPENWHALHDVLAMKAGKDVYGEKGLTLTVAEGQKVVQTARRYGRVFQVGTQQRSGGQFRQAVELARNGYLGDLKEVRVSAPSGQGHFAKLGIVPAKPVPEDIAYDLWLGPAPWTPFNDRKCTYYWYFMSDYCAGWIQSWGIHHLDIALWGAPIFHQGKIKVEGSAKFPTDGLADVSYAWQVRITASNGLPIIYKNDESPGFGHGVHFVGTEGWVHVTRGGIKASSKSLLDIKLKPTDERVHLSNHHHDDFFKAVRSRRDPVAPVEGGHSANTISLVSDIATRIAQPLTFDWSTERFVNDDTANLMLHRTYRAPWRL